MLYKRDSNKCQIVYFSHGGGPLPILGDESHKGMVDFMLRLPQRLKKPDAILVINYPKKGIEGYIGGNTFLEMGYAFGLKKKIFVLFPLPHMDYEAEMHAMEPMVLDGDLGKIG